MSREPTTTVMPPDKCPSCGYLLDAATSIGHRSKPTAGDFTLCAQCGEILRFDERLRVVLPSGAWWKDLARVQLVCLQTAQAIIRDQADRGRP